MKCRVRIDMAGLESMERMKVDNIKPVDHFVFPAGHGVLLLASDLQEQCPLLTKELDQKAAQLHL